MSGDRLSAWMWKRAPWLIWGWVIVMLVLTFVGYFRGTL